MLTAPLPFGHTSVMAGRQADDGDGRDYFPTPPWAARAGGELIATLDPDARTCWEPAAGGGHMAHALRETFHTVAASDIHQHGGADFIADFLQPGIRCEVFGHDPDWIITNPPFVHGEAFFRLGWERATRGVAMLLRLAFIESAARYRLFQEIPLTVLAPFSERVPMVKGRWDPDASSATAYAWFICTKPEVWPTPWHGEPRVRLIPPGTKARLQTEEDLRLFGPDRGATLDLSGEA